MKKIFCITIAALLLSSAAFADQMTYIQYDPATGAISAAVTGEHAPAIDNQIAVPVGTPTDGMRVDTTTTPPTLVPVDPAQ